MSGGGRGDDKGIPLFFLNKILIFKDLILFIVRFPLTEINIPKPMPEKQAKYSIPLCFSLSLLQIEIKKNIFNNFQFVYHFDN